MKITDAKTTPNSPNPHEVDTKLIYDTEHAQVVYMTLKPGESLKKHVTPVDVFFYVLEGSPTIEIGDENVQVGPDNMVDSPARIPHRIHNRTGETVRLLVGKVPRQKEPTKIL